MTDTPTAQIIDVTEQTFMQDIVERSHSIPVLVDFWADWCGPCQALMPVLENLVTAQPERFVLARVNADTEQALTAQFGVRSLPTVVLVKAGAIAGHFMGAQPQSEVERFLDEHLGITAEPEATPETETSDETPVDNPELDLLRASYDANPSPASAHALAMALATAQQYEEAFALLLALLQEDLSWNQNQGRQDFQELLKECPDKALAATYQRKLMTLLF
jgi:putative thioredoxin